MKCFAFAWFHFAYVFVACVEKHTKSLQNRSQTSPNLSKSSLGTSFFQWNPFLTLSVLLKLRNSSIKPSKNCPWGSKSLPNLSQKLPKTPPKPSQNPFKNMLEKNMLLELIFCTIFLNFDFKNHEFFNACLLRSNIQISLIFAALSLPNLLLFD